MTFEVTIVGRKTDSHAACLDDFAEALTNTFRTLGHTIGSGGTTIVLGARGSFPKIAGDVIVYNAEQLVGADPNELRRVLQDYPIWDYAATNVRTLRAAGLTRVRHVPIGFDPAMTRIQPASVEDVDVLFYGSLNERRIAVLRELQAAHLGVKHLFDVYGAERDAWIARAKVVLNLHYYDRPIFEIFRVSHLLANGKCVVSEGGGSDPELEDFAARATRLVDRTEIVGACHQLVQEEAARRSQAERGRVAFQATSLVESVRRALRADRVFG